MLKLLLPLLLYTSLLAAETDELVPQSSLTPVEALALSAAPDVNVIFLDVRSEREWQAGHLKGALHIPHPRVAEQVDAVIGDTDAIVVTYCASGGRASMVIPALKQRGYQAVPVIGGGFRQLVDVGLPVADN